MSRFTTSYNPCTHLPAKQVPLEIPEPQKQVPVTGRLLQAFLQAIASLLPFLRQLSTSGGMEGPLQGDLMVGFAGEALTVDLLGVAGEGGLDAARAVVEEHHHTICARCGDQALAARRRIDGQNAALHAVRLSALRGILSTLEC